MILQIFREEFTYIKTTRRNKSALLDCQYNLSPSISVSPRVGSHKLFKFIHLSDALDIVFLLEPLLDGCSIKIQAVALADKRNVVTPDRSVHRRFRFAKQFANILHAHQFPFKRLWLLLLTNCLLK